MALAGTQLFIARYNRTSNGCTLHAFATSDGKLLWKVPLQAVGEHSHSKR
jgi:hypothetical protein